MSEPAPTTEPTGRAAPRPDDAAAPPRGRDRLALAAGFVALLTVQAAAIGYFEPFEFLLSTTPISTTDFDTHWEQTLRVTEALKHWGHAWAWDPQLLAGFPNGTVFDADNKGWELWTYGLWQLGVPRGLAFNLFVLLAHLLLPWTVYLAARLFRLARPQALTAAGLALALWYADGFVHYAAWTGMVAFAMSSYLWLLPLACLYRYLEDRRPRHALGLALTLPTVLLVHPYSFVPLVVPMVALYVRAWRGLAARDHAVVWGAALLAVLANLWWLLTALRFWHYVLGADVLGAARLEHLGADYLGLVYERTVSGASGMRTGFRFLAFAAAGAALWEWRRRRDSRFLPLAVGLGVLLTAAYLGGYSAWLRHVQPYRHIVPALFLAAIPAAAFLADAWTERRKLPQLPRAARLALLLLLVAAVPRLARDVLFACPAPLPEAQAEGVAWPKITDITAFGTLGFPKHRPFVRRGPTPEHERIADFVRRHDDGSGRILVEEWLLGEHLAGRTDAQVMGGFRMLNLEHAKSNLFRRHPFDPPDAATLRAYLERYAVRFAILSDSRELYTRRFPELLEPLGEIGPYRLFRTRFPVDWFAANRGRVRASLNRLVVRDTDPDRDVVLRFHWLETLVCRPGCRLEREPVPDDPVGFVRVPAPHPADFVVENGY